MKRLVKLLRRIVEAKFRGSEIPPAHLEHVARTQGWLSLEEAELLYQLARGVASGCIVEIGSYRGRSTVALALGSLSGSKVPIYAVDPHEVCDGALGGGFGPEDRAEFFRAMLRTSCYKIVRPIDLSSEIITPGWTQPVGLLWIDGDHSYGGAKRDFGCWGPHLADNACVAFDDSLDPRLGPAQVIEEALAQGDFEKLRSVGKVTVLRKAGSSR